MFKVGDKVKRKADWLNEWWEAKCFDNSVSIHKTFTVSSVSPETVTDYESINLVDFDDDYGLISSNFELVESAKETNMISLKENKTALVNLKLTIDAIENLDQLIEHYSEDKLGPAYVEMKHVRHGSVDVQIDRKFMVVALVAQRQKLVDYIATLGIDANN